MEILEKINSSTVIKNGFSDIDIALNSSELVLRLYYANFASNPMEGGVLTKFGSRSVVSFQYIKEAVHSVRNHDTQEPWPLLEGKQKYIYPILKILNSAWIEALNEDQKTLASGKTLYHYRMLSLNGIVDVISSSPPTILGF